MIGVSKSEIARAVAANLNVQFNTSYESPGAWAQAQTPELHSPNLRYVRSVTLLTSNTMKF